METKKVVAQLIGGESQEPELLSHFDPGVRVFQLRRGQTCFTQKRIKVAAAASALRRQARDPPLRAWRQRRSREIAFAHRAPLVDLTGAAYYAGPAVAETRIALLEASWCSADRAAFCGDGNRFR